MFKWNIHILEHAINSVPSSAIAQLYPQQFMKHKYDCGWNDSEREQGEGYELNVQRMCSVLCTLAGCVAKTTTAIGGASESASERAHIMNQNRFSKRLWKGTIQELIDTDNTLLMSLSNSTIVVYHDDIVVTTPHGQMIINHANPESQPDSQLAAIQTKGENDNPNGTQAFQYARHSKDATRASIEGNCPRLAPEMHQYVTIKTKVNRCKPYIMLDTRSTGNFMSPTFAKVIGMNTFPLEKQLTLQLGCISSQSKITHGGNGHIEIRNKVSEIYFNIANINCCDCILGIPFL